MIRPLTVYCQTSPGARDRRLDEGAMLPGRVLPCEPSSGKGAMGVVALPFPPHPLSIRAEPTSPIQNFFDIIENPLLHIFGRSIVETLVSIWRGSLRLKIQVATITKALIQIRHGSQESPSIQENFSFDIIVAIATKTRKHSQGSITFDSSRKAACKASFPSHRSGDTSVLKHLQIHRAAVVARLA